MNKTQEFFAKNRDLMQLIGYIAGGVLVVLAIIGLIVYAVNESTSPLMIGDNNDDAGHINVATGLSELHSIAIEDYDSLIEDLGLPQTLRIRAIAVVQNFYSASYNGALRLEYQKESFSQDADKYNFSFNSNVNERFEVELIVNGGYNFTMDISDKNNLLLSYDSSLIQQPSYTKTYLINSSLLPHTVTLSNDLRATLRKETYSDDLTLYVNTCGDESIRIEAISKITEWLTSEGFNLHEIDYDIPMRFCDGAI